MAKTVRTKKTPVRKTALEQPASSVVGNSYKSLAIGFIAVAVSLSLFFALFPKKKNMPEVAQKIPPTETLKTSVSPTKTPELATSSGGLKTVSPTSIVKKLPFTKGDATLYTVKIGDNLATIGYNLCNKNRNAWVEIASDNNIPAPYTLHSGQTLSLTCPH